MKRRFNLQLVGLLVILMMTGISLIAQGNTLGLTTTIVNARSGPDVTFDIITQYPHATTVSALGRNDGGDWLFVRAIDTGIEAWATTTYINLPNGFEIFSLPVQQATPAQSVAQPQQSQEQVGSSSAGFGVTISTLNVRSGGGENRDSISSVAVNVRVIIESRNQFGDWILVRATDGSVRGWVASRYVNFDEGVSLDILPISTEIIGATQAEQVLSDFDPNATLPDAPNNALAERLHNTPILHNFRTQRIVSTFWLGKQYDNRPNVFMKVGDSVTDSQPFLLAYGQGGGYNLGNYGYLQDTINHFAGVSPRDGVANSFTNRSFSAITGATSSSMLDGLWSDPNSCGSESPLMCEINLTRPSVGFVLFGTQDMRVIPPHEFRIHMSQIVEAMIFNGVIPVISTFHNTQSYYGDEALVYNNIIVDISDQYEVPLINLWKATQPLPNNGVNVNDPVHLSQGADNYYNFNGEETQYGVNVRNLLSLQALDELRNNILLQR
jgi:uncharacterized protein YraI